MRSRFFFSLLLGVVLLLMFMCAPAFAQDVTPPALPSPTVAPTDAAITILGEDGTPIVAPDAPLVDVPQAGNTIITTVIALVSAGLAGAGLAPVVTTFVGFAKKFLDVSAPTLNAVFSLLIWLTLAVAARFGLDHQVSSLLGLVAQMLPLLYGFVATLASAPAIHEWMAAHNVPILGDKKTPELVTAVGQTAELAVESGAAPPFPDSQVVTRGELATLLDNYGDIVAEKVRLRLSTAAG